VRALVAPEGTPPERAQRVAAVQRELLETDAGPAALAIAGIAANRSSAAAKVFDEAGPGRTSATSRAPARWRVPAASSGRPRGSHSARWGSWPAPRPAQPSATSARS
jgi:hypothetical protein